MSVLAGDREVASFTLTWRNAVERDVLVTAVAVVALDAGADTVVATGPAASGSAASPATATDAGVAVVTGWGASGPAPLVALLSPVRAVLPPNRGFRPLAAEVDAAHRNLAADPAG